MESAYDSSMPSTLTPPPGMGEWESPWARVIERLREVTRGEYEIERELGRGGMAAVFLARDLALDRKVAIKVMSPALLAGEGMVARFQREAITVAKLDHPHIITIHAVRQVEELHFLVLKFVAGRSLESILHTAGPLPLPIARALLHQVGHALGYAHRRGVVHRDVKPGNILVDIDGNAVVTDFGIAKVAESTTQTQTGAIVGTPAYISPEQCYAETATGLSDQYALGVVAFEMLTGRPPFTGTSFVVMQSHVEAPVPSIRELRPDVPDALEAAIARMLAKKPEDRFPTMAHALAAMEAAPLAELSEDRDRLIGMATPDVSMPAIRTPPTSMSPPPRTTLTSRNISAIELVAPSTRLEAGDRARIEVQARDETGAIVPPAPVRWAVDPATVAAIDAEGVLTSLAPGLVTVTAISSGIRSQTTITVTPPRVATVRIVPSPGALRAGTPIQLTATAYDRRNAPMRRPVIWELVDGRASLSADGVLLAERGGEVVVVAETEGVRGELRLVVADARIAELRIGAPDALAPDESMQLDAEALDARGQPIDLAEGGRRTTWRSSDPEVIEVSELGVARARALGVATITLECEGKVATADLRVLPADAIAQRITRSVAPSVADGPSSSPSRGRGSRRPVLLAGVAIVVVAAAIALLSRGGDVAPQAVDTSAVLQSGASTAATVALAPVASALEEATPRVAKVSIAPPGPLTLNVGDTRRFVATAFDSAGVAIEGSTARWSSGDTALARVDTAGLVTALAAGNVSIYAAIEGQRQRARLTIRPVLPSEEVARVLVEEYLTTLRARDDARIVQLASALDSTRRADAKLLADFVRSSNRIGTSDPSIQPARADGNVAVVAFSVDLSGSRGMLRRDFSRRIEGELRLERGADAWRTVAAYPTTVVR